MVHTIDVSDLSKPTLRYSDIGTGDTRFSGIIADKFVLKHIKLNNIIIKKF